MKSHIMGIEIGLSLAPGNYIYKLQFPIKHVFVNPALRCPVDEISLPPRLPVSPSPNELKRWIAAG